MPASLAFLRMMDSGASKRLEVYTRGAIFLICPALSNAESCQETLASLEVSNTSCKCNGRLFSIKLHSQVENSNYFPLVRLIMEKIFHYSVCLQLFQSYQELGIRKFAPIRGIMREGLKRKARSEAQRNEDLQRKARPTNLKWVGGPPKCFF
jgi:hypothetical protein